MFRFGPSAPPPCAQREVVARAETGGGERRFERLEKGWVDGGVAGVAGERGGWRFEGDGSPRVLLSAPGGWRGWGWGLEGVGVGV